MSRRVCASFTLPPALFSDHFMHERSYAPFGGDTCEQPVEGVVARGNTDSDFERFCSFNASSKTVRASSKTVRKF